MTSTLLAGIVAILVLPFVLGEIISAVRPLRFAVAMRRQERRVAREARDPLRNPYAHLNEHFAQMPGDGPVNQPYRRAEAPARGQALSGPRGPRSRPARD